MNTSKIVRHAQGENVRVLEVVVGRGKTAVHNILSTKIEKVKLPDMFAKVGGKTVPIEQYGFKVGSLIGARFADAASIVLKKHGVEIPVEGLDSRQAYVQKAVAIMNGTDLLQDVTSTFVAPASAESTNGGVQAA